MGRKLQAFSRYRPRFLTLLVLLLTATLLVLSNLSYAGDPRWGYYNYGWPMVWWRMIVAISAVHQVHRLRLAMDVAIWLLILVATGGVCEWLLRRYRPRLRWSLRTMLVVTALVAACCGWFSVASRRARQQGEIWVLLQAQQVFEGGSVWIERWGPRWLGFFGLERYFQQLAGAIVKGRACGELILPRLQEVPTLRLLYLHVDQMPPAMIEPLSAMRQLRILSVTQWAPDSRQPTDRACLAAIGGMSRLDELSLRNLGGDALSELADLRRLRRLHLQFDSPDDDNNYDTYTSPPWLSTLPIFPRLETLTFNGPYLVRDDLHRIAAQPNLKALRIEAPIIVADLAALRALGALEELTIVAPLRAADILALRGLKRLRFLHIGDGLEESEAPAGFDAEAMTALRQARRGITIDHNSETLQWDEYRAVSPEYMQGGQHSQALSAPPWLHAWFWKRDDHDQKIIERYSW
ncbi:MAG TPA: hypothetical protein VF278_16445 [Pirellulales bacterium]